MLRNALKYVFVLMLMVTAFSAAAFAESTQATYDPCTGASDQGNLQSEAASGSSAHSIESKALGPYFPIRRIVPLQSCELVGGLLPAYAGKGAVRNRTQGLFRSIERRSSPWH